MAEVDGVFKGVADASIIEKVESEAPEREQDDAKAHKCVFGGFADDGRCAHGVILA